MINTILTEGVEEKFDIAGQFLDVSKGLSGETISSLILVGIIILLCIYISIRAHFANPLKKPRGILFLAEVGVTFFDNLVESVMGKRFRNFGGFIMAVGVYLFMAFIWGLTGLPSPIVYLATPLSLGLVTFVLIHATSVRYTGIRYFKRYVEPIPLLSLTMRLFGNALAGWTIMTLIYSAVGGLGNAVCDMMGQTAYLGTFITPIVTPILHAYFDLFSGLIQTAVFLFLSMIFISNEGPEEDIEELAEKGGN